METNLNQQQTEGRNADVFRKLLEIQILLNVGMSHSEPYDKEIKKIIQSIDDLFDRMLEV